MFDGMNVQRKKLSIVFLCGLLIGIIIGFIIGVVIGGNMVINQVTELGNDLLLSKGIQIQIDEQMLADAIGMYKSHSKIFLNCNRSL